MFDLLRARLGKEDSVTDEAFLLIVWMIAIAQDDKPAHHACKAEKGLQSDGEVVE